MLIVFVGMGGEGVSPLPVSYGTAPGCGYLPHPDDVNRCIPVW
ncbi:MAG: hypothetical protein ACLVEJ_03325 [Parabacteroides sp.]